jgi:DNA-binding NtrC family response regulator
MLRVLLVEARDSARRQLLLALRKDGIEAEGVPGKVEAGRALAENRSIDVVLLGLETASVPEILHAISHTLSHASPERSEAAVRRPADVVVYLAQADQQAGLAAIRQGAADFVCLPSPFAESPAALWLALSKAEARRAAALGLAPAGSSADRSADRPAGGGAGMDPPLGPPGPSRARDGGGTPSHPHPAPPPLVGASPEMTALAAMIRRLAAARASVLVGGESGTGKELVAQALHRESPWARGPFVPVNCGAISPGLVESELFGHVRGAFTDAHRDKRGLFESAHGGTLFLDEIADLPLDLQPKLLRAIQEGEIRRVGDVEDLHVQVRVVAATARDLLAEVGAGRFREDLYYRLSALSLRIPPLRERTGDIPLLAAHFLERARRRLSVEVSRISPEAMEALTRYRWPGNVRELENTIERAAVMCGGSEIDVASLPERVHPPVTSPTVRGTGAPGPAAGAAVVADFGAARSPAGGPPAVEDLSIKRAARRSEEELIRRALARTSGNRTRAAELLEISPRALLYKIKEYRIFDKGLPPNGDGEGDGNVRDPGSSTDP